MSKKLFVGCRVRILRSTFYPALVGHEGRVVGLCDDGGRLGDSEYIVAPDVWGSEVEPFGWGDSPGRCWFAPNSSQLEPILPDGHRAGDYSYTELMDRCRAGEVECV